MLLFFHGIGLLPKRKLQGMFRPIRGGFFILQLHDELLYEVAEEDVVQVFLQSFLFYRMFGTVWVRLRCMRFLEPFPSPRWLHQCWVLKGLERTKSAQCHTIVTELPGTGMFLSGRSGMRIWSLGLSVSKLKLVGLLLVSADLGCLALLNCEVPGEELQSGLWLRWVG